MAEDVGPGSDQAPAEPKETSPAEPREAEPSVAELVAQLAEQSSRLLRNELQLAIAEMQQKAKRAGLGAGMFGAAGIVALFGGGALVTTAILALALALPAWLSALIVTAVLFAIAGVVALVGRRQVAQATPAAPVESVERVKRDVETLKKGAQRAHDE